jgi:DNA (cytosine-5)-methyltransferase 1
MSRVLNVLDLCSGIGGFSLGFGRAGLRSVAFCEADPFARAVLQRHWPAVPCYDDIRTLSARRLRRDGVPAADLICGGFPCQDISAAGRGAGLDGSRSGLWHEMLRVVLECRPDWVVVENSPVLRVRGADRVLQGLEAADYACWPLVVGAAHAGAPHRRRRVFILAHALGTGLENRLRGAAHPPPGLPVERCRGWPSEPAVGRVVDGLPAGMDRLRRLRLGALGCAVIPDVAAVIGQAILTIQAAADRTRSANTLRNLATFGATTARQ